MAAGSELVVTRASGVSVWRMAWPVGLAGLTLSLIMYAVGEYVAPPLAQFAKREKTTSKLADVSFAGTSSAWVKDGNLILRVQTGEVDQSFGGVSLFELDGPEPAALHPARGSHLGRRSRPLAHAQRGDHHVSATIASTAAWSDEVTIRSTVNPDFLGLAATDPDLLTLRGLGSYIEHLRRNSLDTSSYEIGYWSRIARIFAVIIVTLLALPFVFGPLRTTGAGTRTVIGVMLGMVFFLITRTVENGGQLFGLNPGAGRLAADGRDRRVHADRDLKNALGADHARSARAGRASARCSGSM